MSNDFVLTIKLSKCKLKKRSCLAITYNKYLKKYIIDI